MNNLPIMDKAWSAIDADAHDSTDPTIDAKLAFESASLDAVSSDLVSSATKNYKYQSISSIYVMPLYQIKIIKPT